MYDLGKGGSRKYSNFHWISCSRKWYIFKGGESLKHVFQCICQVATGRLELRWDVTQQMSSGGDSAPSSGPGSECGAGGGGADSSSTAASLLFADFAAGAEGASGVGAAHLRRVAINLGPSAKNRG